MKPEKFQKMVLRRTLEILADREAEMRAQSEGHRATAARLQIEYDQASAVSVKKQLKQTFDQELALAEVCSAEANQIRARADMIMGLRRTVQPKEAPRKRTIEDVQVTLRDLEQKKVISPMIAESMIGLAQFTASLPQLREIIVAGPWSPSAAATMEALIPAIDEILAS